MPWIKAITPKQMHDVFGYYQGDWMPQMDRCWIRTEDGVCVSSRLLRTQWGKVEHVTVTRGLEGLEGLEHINSGDRGFTWSELYGIKNELFGKNRAAVEVFPTEDRLIDMADVYHLWVFDKSFQLPFGIHPKESKLFTTVNRGAMKLTQQELETLQGCYQSKGGNLEV